MLLLTIAAVGAFVFLWAVAWRRYGHPVVANPATDRQRRYIADLLDERNIANPPDPNDPRLSKEAASELILPKVIGCRGRVTTLSSRNSSRRW